ncbi:ribose 5-phosphate isomerase B [uncultured Tyzzerella sp.]|uniref:ribose 5-phosphate isomerase B n=1 Tax=uncultured Tyzzerella sp. TaxID=2321398 RepID=UPI002941C2E1|nr:ribose 5-phosphate isomerase B [uncultured Tyzzerella sp.]
MKNIIFVCTGNTCRSPMAEAIAKSLCKNKDISISSRGIFVYNNLPINENSKKVLSDNKINIPAHISRPITITDFKNADLILTMEKEHKNILIQFGKTNNLNNNKIFTLYEYVLNKNLDIRDPFGLDISKYTQCFNEIYSLISKINFKNLLEVTMIGIGSDHGGFHLKSEVIKYLEANNIPFKDYGTYSTEAVDYPIYSKKVANDVANGTLDKGILICGTGIGISIAANKVKGVRAALCHDVFSAKATREHNNANILAMGERVIGPGLALEIVKAFLDTPFSNDARHIKRVDMIEE